MLFNSYEFIFLFLPASLIGFRLLGGLRSRRAAIIWLASASLIFYAWWNPRYVTLLACSILFNFLLGTRLSGQNHRSLPGKWLLAFGVCCNLALLGYYKYANFFVDTLNTVVGNQFHLTKIVLALGISFFTFTQIAYLVDAYRKEVSEYRLRDYALFVTFFPHLIAGPILHHREIMPQFADLRDNKSQIDDFAVGVSIFVLGLFKKVVLADGVAVFADKVFDNAALGFAPTFTEAWIGALAYAFQLYFDFSGYSDMAVGAARLFGVRFPLNFLSPYKAANIIDFWRRWHVTLSRFLRDYVYFTLGGNRKGKWRRYVNLLATMALGGLWHGAGWTFVLWGLLHGMYLVVNHAWHALRTMAGHDFSRRSTTVGLGVGRAITFLAVLAGWVLFRAKDSASALVVLSSMAGLRGHWLGDLSISGLAWVCVLAAITWLLPNSYEFMRLYAPVLEVERLRRASVINLTWSPRLRWAMPLGVIGLVCVLRLTHVSQFLYYQF